MLLSFCFILRCWLPTATKLLKAKWMKSPRRLLALPCKYPNVYWKFVSSHKFFDPGGRLEEYFKNLAVVINYTLKLLCCVRARVERRPSIGVVTRKSCIDEEGGGDGNCPLSFIGNEGTRGCCLRVLPQVSEREPAAARNPTAQIFYSLSLTQSLYLEILSFRFIVLIVVQPLLTYQRTHPLCCVCLLFDWLRKKKCLHHGRGSRNVSRIDPVRFFFPLESSWST